MAPGLSNWGGNLRYSAHTLHEPASISEDGLCLLRQALHAGIAVYMWLGEVATEQLEVQAVVRRAHRIRDSAEQLPLRGKSQAWI